ncbi:MAG TPA: isoamylase early set domain-containing protein [Syntrophobacter fumaroxidans]|nr:isoamylase early set domain-containing protein [Syntrophobacter fumaroxidans]
MIGTFPDANIKVISMRNRFIPAVIAALLLPVFLAHCTPALVQNGPENQNIPVRFILIAPGAGSVCVAGSFNGWSRQSHCMRREGSTWAVSLRLPPGRYEYAFVLDGKTWQADPGATLSEESGFGRKNSILIVE